MGFGVWGLKVKMWGLGFGVWSFRFRVCGLWFWVWSSGSRVQLFVFGAVGGFEPLAQPGHDPNRDLACRRRPCAPCPLGRLIYGFGVWGLGSVV